MADPAAGRFEQEPDAELRQRRPATQNTEGRPEAEMVERPVAGADVEVRPAADRGLVGEFEEWKDDELSWTMTIGLVVGIFIFLYIILIGLFLMVDALETIGSSMSVVDMAKMLDRAVEIIVSAIWSEDGIL